VRHGKKRAVVCDAHCSAHDEGGLVEMAGGLVEMASESARGRDCVGCVCGAGCGRCCSPCAARSGANERHAHDALGIFVG
jgi:hypothetical protein